MQLMSKSENLFLSNQDARSYCCILFNPTPKRRRIVFLTVAFYLFVISHVKINSEYLQSCTQRFLRISGFVKRFVLLPVSTWMVIFSAEVTFKTKLSRTEAYTRVEWHNWLVSMKAIINKPSRVTKSTSTCIDNIGKPVNILCTDTSFYVF